MTQKNINSRSAFNVFAIGDVVGPLASEALIKNLKQLRETLNASFVVVNGENACTGNGIDSMNARAFFCAGTDVITSGNHVWHKKDIKQFLNDCNTILRPLNYSAGCPGRGSTIVERGGKRILVMNVLGTIFMDPFDNPYDAVENELKREAGNYDISILDIHAEATSEKLALAYYFDSKINIIFGTHTHVQTADERVLPGGSGYITDLGMTGPTDSVLGIKKEIIIEKNRTHMPVKFEIAENPIRLEGALFTLDADTGAVLEITRVTHNF